MYKYLHNQVQTLLSWYSRRMACCCHSWYDTASTAKLPDFLISLLHGEGISKLAVPKSSLYMKTVLHITYVNQEKPTFETIKKN